jgi:hypothetical protein
MAGFMPATAFFFPQAQNIHGRDNKAGHDTARG